MSPTPNSPDDPTSTAAKDDVLDELDRVEVAEDEQSRLATHNDPTLATEPEAPAAADGRARVEWVRPTDLAARAGGRVMEGGHELNRQLASAVKEAAREQRHALRQRLAARGADVSVTGPERALGRAAGREEVSR